MTSKRKKSSRIRMASRLKGRREGPTVIYDRQVPPHPFACNRAAERGFIKSGIDHTRVPTAPIRNVGRDKSGAVIYLMGDQRFVPPYLWNRVKKKAKAKRA